MDGVVIFGASRGLGRALARKILAAGHPVTGWARSEKHLQEMDSPGFSACRADLSQAVGQDEAIAAVLMKRPAKIFCVAGGGPYGPFGKKSWASHEWAWALSFLFPARLLHALSAANFLPQVVLIGSSVAESAPDPLAASYCAAKHALRGLYSSLKAENPNWDLRLFSPGYMDTDLLPKNAAVRQRGVYDPQLLAGELWSWTLTADKNSHRVYPIYPNQETAE